MSGNRKGFMGPSGRRQAWLVAGLVLSAVPALAQTVAITGGRVFPVSGPVIENGTVVIRDGRIVAVGAQVEIPLGAARVDATGRWVTPGIINAATSLGLVEVGQVQETVDTPARGRGDAVTASLRVWDGFNPASPLIQVTRNDGITTVGVAPGGNLISGQAALVDLADGSLADMMLRSPVAMLADIGSKGQDRGVSRGEVIQRLREILADTREYARRRPDYERNQSRELAARRSDLEALIPVLEGRMPLLVSANRASDIQGALALAREFRLRLILESAAEAWKVAAEIAAAGVPVLVGSMSNIPQTFASLGTRQDNAALLRQAGVKVVVHGGVDSWNARNVKYEAGVAVAFGLPWDEALRSVTLTPAEVFGVADRVGSLQPGRDATLVIWSGDPFELYTRAEKVYVRGREVQRMSRQDELMRRYRTLPPTFRGTP
jgi:imidazolonepropionase-like amidohydrolase